MLSKCFPAQTTLQYLKFDDHCHRYQTEKEGGAVGQDGRLRGSTWLDVALRARHSTRLPHGRASGPA